MNPHQVPRPRRMQHLTTDPRGYPVIPAVNRDEAGPDFGSISERRKLVLAAFDWCAVCSLPFQPGDLRWVAGDAREPPTGRMTASSGEAPVHQLCLLYAAQVCPFLASPGGRHTDPYRRGERRTAVSSLLGFRATAGVAVLPGEVQKREHLLHFGLADIEDVIRYGYPQELTGRYAALLADEAVPALTGAEAGLVALFNAMDGDHPVTGAALMAGAAFLPGVFGMAGMKAYARKVQTDTGVFPVYRAFANAALDLDNPAGFIASLARKDDGDPAFGFAAAYLLERPDTLPPLLAKWRAEGRRLNTMRAERNAQPRRTSRARRRKAGT